MKNDIRADYVTRDAVLKLLSDEEAARVSTAETADRLADGDEYLDLTDLDRGVLWARRGKPPAMGTILPRSAVLGSTWRKILAKLASTPAGTTPPRP